MLQPHRTKHRAMIEGLRRSLLLVLLGMNSLLVAPLAIAAELTLDVGSPMTLTTQELLARPDVATIHIPSDVSYRRAMTYQAVPLRSLLGMERIPFDGDLQIVATDGFVTNLPFALLNASGPGAVPWLAIEPLNQPWPKTPNGVATGPFYLVWLNPAASGIMSEQWPFQVAAIRKVAAHTARWPQLAVGDDVPTSSPIRSGQLVFATQCMVCHRMSGAGDATVGPDLNIPRNPTEYFQPWALKAFIRNPQSLRSWPEMRMPGFEQEAVSDTDLDAIIAYLAYIAGQRR